MPFKFADIFFVAFALFACLIFLLKPYGTESKQLVLLSGDKKIILPYIDGVVHLKDITGKNMLLEVKNGSATMISSSCSDKICINSGKIDKCGEAIICMPNETAVMIDCLGDNYED